MSFLPGAVTGRDGRPGGGLGTAGPFPAVRCQRREGGARIPADRAAQDVSQRAQEKDSAGEAGTRMARGRERSLAARSERSERPVAGTDAAAQADKPGREEPQSRCHPSRAETVAYAGRKLRPRPLSPGGGDSAALSCSRALHGPAGRGGCLSPTAPVPRRRKQPPGVVRTLLGESALSGERVWRRRG